MIQVVRRGGTDTGKIPNTKYPRKGYNPMKNI